MDDVELGSTEVSIVVPIAETRFMVMAPGGENPRPNLIPNLGKIGIRIRGGLLFGIQEIRERFCSLESPDLLGNRKPSTRTHSAFGAKNYQPHVTLLRAGNKLPSDLRPAGEDFRNSISNLHFDRLVTRLSDPKRSEKRKHALR